ncbi:hypothetical protein QR680_015560 [Steinernema hermaphroditum]|uniref:Uncharacterized protein n=1 Tax=Steinernema hermaphroditum TaxID=289476 RepID=A0AA39LL38_9BILA|nr:hypothetical protein QR680_015560 [Steinernema hermaphroditum]
MSEYGAFDLFFNRALDISAAFHVPLKLFSMYIVFRHSPKNMDALPIFILNVMFWNLMCNVTAAFLHINPQFPAQCHRADGPIGILSSNEFVYHGFYAGLFTCIMNCSLALSFAFPYRYLVFAHPKFMLRVNPKWGILVCLGIHVSLSAFFAYIYTFFVRSYNEYFGSYGEPRPNGIFCFWSYGWHKNLYLISYFIVISLAFGAVGLFGFLIWKHLSSMNHMFTKQTLEINRKFLRYLMINTSVPLTFGGGPFLICLFYAVFPGMSHGREITMVCTIILYNHGAVYSVVSIVTFRPYYNAARRIMRRVLGMDKTKVKKVMPR